MHCVFNLWLNIVAGSPGTFSVSELPFHTPLTLARLKKACFIWHILQQLGRLESRHGPQGRSYTWGRGSGWIVAAPHHQHPHPHPSFPRGKKEKGPRKRPSLFLFFRAAREKAWEQSLQGFRNIVSVCRMKSLAIEGENERPFYPAQWEGGGDKVKEFTTSH